VGVKRQRGERGRLSKDFSGHGGLWEGRKNVIHKETCSARLKSTGEGVTEDRNLQARSRPERGRQRRIGKRSAKSLSNTSPRVGAQGVETAEKQQNRVVRN